MLTEELNSYHWNAQNLWIIESFTLEKTSNIIKSNCKLNTAKFTKRSNGMTKHPPPGAFYSAAGGDVSGDKGENFNHTSLLVIETFPYRPTITPNVLFPPAMVLTLTGAQLDNNFQVLHTDC